MSRELEFPPNRRAAFGARRALRSKSLLGRARQPLGARNQVSGALQSHSALEIAARADFFVFYSARKHCPTDVFSHSALKITARACSAGSGRSKSLLGQASKPLSARNRCLLRIRQHLKAPLATFSRIPLDITVGGHWKSKERLGRAPQPFT